MSDSIIEKKEGESCGPCFSLTGDCGTCIEGLECTPDPRQAEMPDLPNTCQPVGKDRSSLASTSHFDVSDILRNPLFCRFLFF